TPSAGRLGVARRLVRAEVAELLGRDVSEHEDRKGLMGLGFDSLRSVALSRRLSDQLEQRVLETITFSRPTVDALARFVLEALSLDSEQDAILVVSDRSVEREAEDPIAIVGAGCRLPGDVVDLGELWTLLEGSRDESRQFPADRWDVAVWLDP